ncbi:MAG: ATP-binding protein [Megasphaera sp.]|nr:ATP-binding protein [Megasphaera sp.]
MKCESLRSLVVCRGFLHDPVVKALMAVQEDERQGDSFSRRAGAAVLLEAAERLGLRGNVLRQYFFYLFGEGRTVAADVMERVGRTGTGMTKALTFDMELIFPYLQQKASDFFDVDFLDDYEPAAVRDDACIRTLAEAFQSVDTPENAAAALLDYYAAFGRGKLARFIAFRLSADGRLIGIEGFPQFDWNDLIGYAAQKEKLLANTEAFVNGNEANNVLLTGSRGTGKSTAVKALVSRYHERGLRLVQLQRDQLQGLQTLMEKLGAIGSKRFILFLDDLSFDENEASYKYLKSAMDGGVTPQPKNVVIYATSNRRHLLKETWHDRNDEWEEVYRDDNTNEAISLSDRFGLILQYAASTQDEYLEIIGHELKKAGIDLDPEQLRIEGLRWEMEHSGRNGRIAQQFVKWYLNNHNS